MKKLSNNNKNILRICNNGQSMLLYLRNQLLDINKAGFNVFVICGYNKELSDFCKNNNISFFPIAFERRFSLFSDIRSFFYLFKFYSIHKIHICHSWNSKCGLLNAIISFIFRINFRVHTFAGIPWENLSFFSSLIPKFADFIIFLLNHKCFADSQSEAKFLNKNLCINSNKISVLGCGSIAGINLKKFNLNRNFIINKWFLKNKNNLIFIGRITKEKGIDDLVNGFNRYALPNTGLLILGDIDNTNGSIKQDTLDLIHNSSSIKWIKFTKQPEKFLKFCDILVIPSYREGFGNVVIEAGAFKVPSIGYKSTGLVDSIKHNHSGYLVKKGNMKLFFTKVNHLIKNKKTRRQFGNNAYQIVVDNFECSIISEEVIEMYSRGSNTK